MAEIAEVPFPKKAARLSWIAPLAGFVLFIIVGKVSSIPAGVAYGVLLLFAAAGLLMGATALLGVKKHGSDGLFVQGLAGAILSASLMAFGIYVYSVTPGPAQKPWMATAELDGAKVKLLLIADDSKDSTGLRALFSEPFSILAVTVDNAKGLGKLTLDPASARLNRGDQPPIKALPPDKILSTAKSNKEKYQKAYGGAVEVAVGNKTAMPPPIIFLPAGIDMSKTVSVTVTINGKETEIASKAPAAGKKEEQPAKEQAP